MPPPPYAYITNFSNNTVSVIDTDRNIITNNYCGRNKPCRSSC